MTTHVDKRTAFDPDDYVRRITDAYRDDPRGFHFEVAYRDGTTPSGRIRYGLRITIDDPHYFDRKSSERKLRELTGGTS